MIGNHEEDEFVAVRVQDPRIQNEGSWNSYVDYKIFLHTNSKAFTAKTSCVRRRYSEFVWLKKKLQKNAGLVPVPELPGKSFFSFSNEDFLERRRKGLQTFLDKVVHTTVCLSDSQLHLFLQTQLPVGHIEDCVQGHTPYSVTDAILTYASSNMGLVQAQDDDSIKESSLTVSYETMESPAPHQPCLQTKETFSPQLLSVGDPDAAGGLLQLCDNRRIQKKTSIMISEKKNHLEAVIECVSGPVATFFLGDKQDDAESLHFAEESEQMSHIQTPVEGHSPVETGFKEDCGVEKEIEVKTDQLKGEANLEKVHCSPEKSCVNSVADLDVQDSGDQVRESDARSQEEVVGDVCCETEIVEKTVISEVNCFQHVNSSEGPVADVSCLEEPDGQREPDETRYVNKVLEVPQMDQKQVEEVLDPAGIKDESDEDSQSLASSNESIAKVSDEESICDETEGSIQAANIYTKTLSDWSEVQASCRNILDLQVNGYPAEKESISAIEDEDLQYMTSLDINSTVAGEDLSESSDFKILGSSCSPGLAAGKRKEQEKVSLMSVDASEETEEVEVH